MDDSTIPPQDSAPAQQQDEQPATNIPAVNGAPADVEMKEEPGAEAPIPPTESLPQAAPPLPPNPYTSTPPPPHVIAPTSTTPLPPSTAPAPPARSSPHPTTTAPVAPPTQPTPHGSPTRIYLNQNVTPYLLEGMKRLAVEEPEKPLRWLAEFLAEKSREVEGA